MKIPDCYEADRQAEALDMAHTMKVARRPRCCKCGSFLEGEIYMDLSDFGLTDYYVCERCLDAATFDVSELDTED
jgi:hypothetical protein